MKAMQAMSALAQPTRLKVFTILAGQHPAGLSAGEIAAKTDTPSNTMSAHLAILSRAGLVASLKKGRVVTYDLRCEPLRARGQQSSQKWLSSHP